MLANHNQAIIQKLAKHTRQTDRTQFRILFVSIAISAFLLFSVFTIGLTYLDLSRLQNTRLYGAEYDLTLINGFTKQQQEVLMHDSHVATVGSQAYCGAVSRADGDKNLQAGLLWADETFWQLQKAPARTEFTGHYPQAADELLISRKLLAACQMDSLSLGERITLTYEDRTGIHTKAFSISGIWDGFGTDQTNFYVSEEFYQQSGYQLNADGILYVKFKSSYPTKGSIETLEKRLHLTKKQVYQPSDYIEQALTILLAVCGLCVLICLSAYLLIYNILYLSVFGKIRYYGLLRTLGMTKKQLLQFIRRQMTVVGIAGIAAGILLAALTSLLLIPYLMKLLGISASHIRVHFYPSVLFVSVLMTTLAILGGTQTPFRIAGSITPMEAVKYHTAHAAPVVKRRPYALRRALTAAYTIPAGPQKCFANSGKKRSLCLRMAIDQLKKDKKKTSVVFLSLATSLTVFYCLTTLIASLGKRTVYPQYWDADLIVHNCTQTTEAITSLQPAIGETLLSEITDIEGVARVYAVRGMPVTFPPCDGSDPVNETEAASQPEPAESDNHCFSSFWLKGYTDLKPYLSYDETIADSRVHPNHYYGMLKGIEEAEFDYLNSRLDTPLEKEDFLSGKTAILQYAGFEIPPSWIGQTISFTADTQSAKITIGAVHYGDYYGASVNIGPNLIVSETYLRTLTNRPPIISFLIQYEQPYQKETEQTIKDLLEKSPGRQDLLITSKCEELETIEASQSGMIETGTVLSLLLLAVGMQNYCNTMASSMQNRRLTFSIMESVGMSRRQVIRLLLREGFLYAAGSVFLTLTIGTAITYLVFQSMNYMRIPFTVPFVPLLCSIALVFFLCMTIPALTYHKTTARHSLIERLRDYR